MKKNILHIAVALVAATSVAALTGCGKKEEGAAHAKPQAKGAAAAEVPRPVRVMQVGPTNLTDASYLPGDVRARYEQRYGFRVAGKIARRLVDVGQVVKAGQVLAVLDSQDVMPAINAQAAQVEAAKADTVLQVSELKRQQELRAKGFISSAALERQQSTTEASDARLKAAQAQLASVKNNLTFQTLTADKAGVVVGIDAEAGSVVGAGQSVVRVAQLGEKELVVNVAERNVGAMKLAKGFAARFDAIPGKVYNATLRELSPIADAASRTYTAKLSITNADDALKLGMSATVRLDLGATPALVVPSTALYTRDNATRLWLVDRATETVRAVEVKLGESTDEGVVVTSGIKAGDLVVTAGANLLQPGQKVRLIDAPPAAAAAAAVAGAAASAAPAAAPTPAAPAAPAATPAASAKP